MSRVRLLQAVAAGALLAVLVWTTKPWDIWHVLRHVEPGLVAAIVLLNVPILAIMARRSQLILRSLGHEIQFKATLPLAIIGNVVGSLTPASSGDLVRTPLLKDLFDVKYSEGLAAVLYERAASLAVLAAATGLTAAWQVSPAAARPAFALAFVAAVALPSLLAGPLARLAERTSTLGEGGGRLAAILARIGPGGGTVLSNVAVLLSDFRLTAWVLSTSTAVVALQMVQMWLGAQALGFSLSMPDSLVVMGASALAAVTSFLPLGLGSLDATMAALLSRAGISATGRAAIVVVMRGSGTLPLVLIAAASYAWLLRAPSRKRAQVPG